MEQFLRVQENFAPPPGIRPSFFALGQAIRRKKFAQELAGGDVSSWN